MRGDPALSVDAGPEMDDRAMPGVGDLQLVGIAQDGANWAAGRAREKDERVLVQRKTLAAEVTADVRCMYDDPVFRHTNGQRQLLAQ